MLIRRRVVPVGAHGGQLAARPAEHDNELAYHSVFAENLISRLKEIAPLSDLRFYYVLLLLLVRLYKPAHLVFKHN